MVGCGQTSPLIDTATSGHRLRKEGVTNRPPAALTPREETTPLDPAIRSTHFGLPPRGGPPVRAVRSAPRPFPPGPAVDPDPGLLPHSAGSRGPRPSRSPGHAAVADGSRGAVDRQPGGGSPGAAGTLPLAAGVAAPGPRPAVARSEAQLPLAVLTPPLRSRWPHANRRREACWPRRRSGTARPCGRSRRIRRSPGGSPSAPRPASGRLPRR